MQSALDTTGTPEPMRHGQFRVAIDGAQSTGKTTLHDHLRKVFSDAFVFVPEASRVVAPQMGVHSRADWEELLANPDRLAAFFDKEEEWLASHHTLDADILVDSSWYMIQAYRKVFSSTSKQRREHHPVYDLVLFCSTDCPGEQDGFRFLKGREEVEQIYLTMVSSWPILDFLVLPPGDTRYQVAADAVRKRTRALTDRRNRRG